MITKQKVSDIQKNVLAYLEDGYTLVKSEDMDYIRLQVTGVISQAIPVSKSTLNALINKSLIQITSTNSYGICYGITDAGLSVIE
jgi:hypothetical protein